jgi:hypothetical protein
MANKFDPGVDTGLILTQNGGLDRIRQKRAV